MQKKILIFVLLILISILIFTRILFHLQLEEFKKNLKELEETELAHFEILKEKELKEFEEKGFEDCFHKFFDENTALAEFDTVFSFFYLSQKVKFKKLQPEYFNCLYLKCLLGKKNNLILNQIKDKEREFSLKYGDLFSTWYSVLKDDKIIPKITFSYSCSNYFYDLNEIIYDEVRWREFDNFLKKVENDNKQSRLINQKVELEFANFISDANKLLRYDLKKLLNEKITEQLPNIIKSQIENKTFSSHNLGIINYEVTYKILDKSILSRIIEDISIEQWNNYSLRTGSVPYYNCFGPNPGCDHWGCSKIRVSANDNYDCVVLIKNSNNKVIRHAYIKAGDSYTFEVPNGSYKVFFYSGNSWNPLKIMPSSSCNILRGGFIFDESVTKDDDVQLHNHILIYELNLVSYGNFKAETSSKEEALK